MAKAGLCSMQCDKLVRELHGMSAGSGSAPSVALSRVHAVARRKSTLVPRATPPEIEQRQVLCQFGSGLRLSRPLICCAASLWQDKERQRIDLPASALAPVEIGRPVQRLAANARHRPADRRRANESRDRCSDKEAGRDSAGHARAATARAGKPLSLSCATS